MYGALSGFKQIFPADMCSCVGTAVASVKNMAIVTHELESLFDLLPDVVFFIKDTEGRYSRANITMIRRLGLERRDQIIGRTATDLYPSPLGTTYAKQDLNVLNGEVIDNHLELQIYPNRMRGWCLTHKRPLWMHGKICGVIGFSRDLDLHENKLPAYTGLYRVYTYLQSHYTENVRISTLADLAGMSVARLERRFQRIFQLSPRQMLTKLRIEAAMRLLHGNHSVAMISYTCGFVDQSAFARQFKAMVGMTPSDYRNTATMVPVTVL